MSPQATLQVFADQERFERTGGSIAGLIAGAGLVTGGLIADYEYDKSYGTAVWAVGIGVIVGSTLALFVRGPMETLALTHGTAPPDELKRMWATEAIKAQNGRQLAAAMTIGVGVASVGAGAAVAAGLGDFDQESKEDWTTVLILGGAGLVGGGIAALFLETPAEQGYRAAYGHLSPAAITAGVAPTPGGASFGVSGRF
jgi:hypothetical protein